jgi:UDP-glucose 4-epimerase
MRLNFIDEEVIVLGGAGFIGSNLVIDLVEKGAKVTVLDSFHPMCGANNFNLEKVKNSVNLVKGDINNTELITSIIKDKSVIFNMAGQTSHPYSMQNPIDDANINTIGIINILEACRKNNKEAKIIQASTRQIYGNQKELPVKETARLNPPDVNAINKIAAEEYIELYNKVYGTKYTTLRLTNTYGPRIVMNKPHAGFISRFLKEIIENKTIVLPKDYLIKRDLNFVDDVNKAFLMAAKSEKNGTYNLGDKNIFTIEEIGNIIKEANNEGELIYPKQAYENNIGIKDIYIDNSKIKENIGWNPEANHVEEFRKTINFIKENRSEYL